MSYFPFLSTESGTVWYLFYSSIVSQFWLASCQVLSGHMCGRHNFGPSFFISLVSFLLNYFQPQSYCCLWSPVLEGTTEVPVLSVHSGILPQYLWSFLRCAPCICLLWKSQNPPNFSCCFQ